MDELNCEDARSCAFLHFIFARFLRVFSFLSFYLIINKNINNHRFFKVVTESFILMRNLRVLECLKSGEFWLGQENWLPL